jgi:hypothetical protein
MLLSPPRGLMLVGAVLQRTTKLRGLWPSVDVCPFVGSTHCEIFRSTKVSEGREEEGQTFGTGSRREELVRLQTYRQSQGQR